MLSKKLYAVLGLTGIVILCGVYYAFNPQHYSFFPQCPFYKITGLDCPGCGSQRAVYCILHGQMLKAVKFNLLLVLSLPFLLIHFGYKIFSLIKKQDLRWAVIYHPLTPKITFVVVMCFWILRNLPVYPLYLFKA